MVSKSHYIIFVIIIIALVSIIYITQGKKMACINESCFNLELAITNEEKAKGLMYRETLPENSGMLFLFDSESKNSFWMKNTLIPLDIIWINKNNEIIHISRNTQPCQLDPCPSYGPETLSMYVLEINSGLSDKYNFKQGDKVVFKGIE